VQIAYLDQPTEDYVRKAAETVVSIHRQHGRGDILVFLTGREEIDRCLEELMDAISSSISGEEAAPKTSSFTLWSQYDRADAGF